MRAGQVRKGDEQRAKARPEGQRVAGRHHVAHEYVGGFSCADAGLLTRVEKKSLPKVISERRELTVHHEAITEGEPPLRILFETPDQALQLLGEPDIVLVCE